MGAILGGVQSFQSASRLVVGPFVSLMIRVQQENILILPERLSLERGRKAEEQEEREEKIRQCVTMHNRPHKKVTHLWTGYLPDRSARGDIPVEDMFIGGVLKTRSR
jgi:hypothetical protein